VNVRLGHESRQLYEKLAESGWRFFSLKEAVACGGKNKQASRKLLERLVRAGWVVKLQRDRYGLAHAEEELNPLAIGRELAGGSGYYVSHGSAMAVWGMGSYRDGVLRGPDGVLRDPDRVLRGPDGKGEMEKVVTISLTGDRRLRPRTVLGWEYQFVHDAEIEEKRLVGTKEKPVHWKVIEMEIAPNELVWVSDPEWTIVCGLGRPDLCGGVAAVARGLERWRERIDLMKLMRYAMQIRNRTAARRLGYLMDVLGMHTEKTQLWLGLAVFKHYGRLEPGQPWKGELERKWRVDVND
jgi:predicted transcriptional regulator of viral defense system